MKGDGRSDTIAKLNDGEIRGMPKVWKQVVSEWFPSTPYENDGTAELEVYPAGVLTVMIMSLRFGFR